MENLKVGDVVILKSGGPEMTISKVDNTMNIAKCEVSSKNSFGEDVLESHDFPVECLKESNKGPQLLQEEKK